MIRRIESPLALVLLWAGVACGPGADVSASLELPSEPSQVAVTPALDLSGLPYEDLRDRLVIEHIAINIEDLRLLGADPRIPAGGLDLLDGARVITADGRDQAALVLDFPSSFASGEDLAVFLRVAPANVLDGASVEIFGRLYASAPTASQIGLEAVDPDVDPARGDEETGAVDPDVDPAHEDEGTGAVDPDVDPAHGGEMGAVDPDVDPAHDGEDDAVDPDVDPARVEEADDEDGAVDPDVDPAHDFERRALIRRAGRAVASVPFVLRDDDTADMVATLGARSQLDLVVGIPASRWLDVEVVRSLESALSAVTDEHLDLASWGSPHADVVVGDHGLLEIRRPDGGLMSSERPSALPGSSNPYFLTSDERVDRNQLDRR
ncbi:MAG: hypothetical protein AAFZ18_26730 [Myxococcota bacterium]